MPKLDWTSDEEENKPAVKPASKPVKKVTEKVVKPISQPKTNMLLIAKWMGEAINIFGRLEKQNQYSGRNGGSNKKTGDQMRDLIERAEKLLSQ